MKLKRGAVLITILLTLLLCGSCNSKPNPEDNSNSVIKANGPETDGDTDTLILYNGTLIDGTGNEPKEHIKVTVRDGRITAVEENTDAPDKTEADNLIDLKGGFLLPGFINAHVHRACNETNLKNWLKGGVTTVRDLGSGDVVGYREKYNSDNGNSFIVLGNSILAPTGGYGNMFYDSAEDVKETVEELVGKDYDIIKFSLEDDLMGRKWAMPTYDEVKAIVDTAHGNNRKVSVHISHVRNLQWAIEAGVDDISHMVVEPLDSKTIEAIVENGIYWIPTLELWNGVSKTHNLDWDKIAIKNLEAFYKMGGKIALGTDFAGYTCEFDKGLPITEIHLMQKAGMKNMDIIVAATRNAAAVCDMEEETGTVEPGKRADLLIVEGDPLTDMDALLNVKMVIHNGVIAYVSQQE